MSTRNFRASISHEVLVKQISYDPATGVFLRLAGRRIGQKAGSRTIKGYWQVSVNGVTYLAHRLAWFYQNKTWPDRFIDHKDGDPLNNSITNLRVANDPQNLANKRCRGVHARGPSFIAVIGVGGNGRHLGSFPTEALARAAYQRAHVEHYGEFSPYKDEVQHG